MTHVERFSGVNEVLIFDDKGVVFAHNIKSFAVKKAVLFFLFHHLASNLARSASQLNSKWYSAYSRGARLIIAQLGPEEYVAITANDMLDEERLKLYLDSVAKS